VSLGFCSKPSVHKFEGKAVAQESGAAQRFTGDAGSKSHLRFAFERFGLEYFG